MTTVEESVVTAMDGSNKEIFQFLPYILQDLWEIGANPEVMINLIKKHSQDYQKLKVLDLGCGKGAVSINLSKQLGCKCHGIDAIPEFIEYAKEKAIEYKVDHLCFFEIGDIREKIHNLLEYDVIILGAIGPVFGDYFSTLTSIAKCLKSDGLILIDNGYIEDDANFEHSALQNKKSIIHQIGLAEMVVVENEVPILDQIIEVNDLTQDNLKKRCQELIEKYPDKADLFTEYISNQEEEINVNENRITCSTMVIKKMA